jgi:hypothetical protein
VVKGVAYAVTLVVIVGTSLPHVPKMYLDYSNLPSSPVSTSHRRTALTASLTCTPPR